MKQLLPFDLTTCLTPWSVAHRPLSREPISKALKILPDSCLAGRRAFRYLPSLVCDTQTRLEGRKPSISATQTNQIRPESHRPWRGAFPWSVNHRPLSERASSLVCGLQTNFIKPGIGKFIPFLIITTLIFLSSCGTKKPQESEETTVREAQAISDDSLFTLVQYKTFQYFWDGAEPNSGMARERFHADGDYPQNDKHVVTTGGSGFGVMAILVGIERGFITRQEGFERLQRIVNFLEKADRFHGIWPHWLNGETGEVKPFSKKDDGADGVESAFLFHGLLTVRQYFKDGNEQEKALAEQIDQLWKEAEWDWFTQGENVLYWHWSPNYGWEMNHQVRGYNECLIYYFLAAASPTHPIDAEVYHKGWARNGDIVSDQVTYGYELPLKSNGSPIYGGPLFWAHYSYLGLDPRGLKDRYADYWKLNKNHTLINRQWCVENPNGHEGYGPDCWGLTASYSYKEGGGVGYRAHKPGEDVGVISPTAALSSFPYTPEYSMQAMRFFYDSLGNKLMGDYGFYDAFSLEHDWFPQRYLAIDQGPIVVMMENHRSQLLWNLFMSCPEVQVAAEKLEFESPQIKEMQ